MIKFKLEDGVELPSRGSRWAAGLDIACNEDFTIEGNSRKMVSTGVSLAGCPIGLYLRVAPRSKLANKMGIDVLAGVVDSDYRGEIKVILHNTDKSTWSFKKGDKIAQLIPETVSFSSVFAVDDVEESERGEDGINDWDLRL